MTEPTAATLRQVAAQLEALLNPPADWPEIAMAVLGESPLPRTHPMHDIYGVLMASTLDDHWWLSAAALKLRAEAAEMDGDVLVTAYGVVEEGP